MLNIILLASVTFGATPYDTNACGAPTLPEAQAVNTHRAQGPAPQSSGKHQLPQGLPSGGTPEPATALLLAGGALAFVGVRMRAARRESTAS